MLALASAAGCAAAAWPATFGLAGEGVPGPDLVLALSASGFVAALFFLLSAQVRRETAAAEDVARAVEERTDAALTSLRQDVRSLKDAISSRSEERLAAVREVADTVAETPTAAAVHDLVVAGLKAGLLDGSVRVHLRGFDVLVIHLYGPSAEETQGILVGVQEESDEIHAAGGYPQTVRNVASGVAAREGDLGDAFAELHEGLVAAQHAWSSFAEEAERALRWCAKAIATLVRAIEQAPEPLALGEIAYVLNEDHVLTRPPEVNWSEVVKLSEPDNPIALTGSNAEIEPVGILRHPLVARELRYQHRVKEEGQKLADRKRATGAMSRGTWRGTP